VKTSGARLLFSPRKVIVEAHKCATWVSGRRAGEQVLECFAHFARRAGRQVNVVAVPGKERARHVALVVAPAAGAELVDGGGVEVERFQEAKRKLVGVERGVGELRNLFFDFDGVHSDGIP